MRSFFKFFALVLLLVPAWIAVLTFTGEDRMKQRPATGPMAVVNEGLQAAKDDRRVSAMDEMEPVGPAGAWHLIGQTAVATAETEMAPPQRFAATLYTKCERLSDTGCWVLDRLDFSSSSAPQSADAPAGPAGTAQEMVSESVPEALVEARAMQMVQEQLIELGFDPGPADGAMGPKTQQAIAAYAAQTYTRTAAGKEANGETDLFARARRDLELAGRLEQGQRHHAEGDFHAAMRAYGTVVERNPENAKVWFYRGLIYQDMGVADLAIAAYDRSLELNATQQSVYRARGNAHFEMGDHWHGFTDHANGLGVRYLGEDYLVVAGRIGDAWAQVQPQLAAVLQWAEGAWQQAKSTLEEKLEHSETPATAGERT